jgi:hypothetical protein
MFSSREERYYFDQPWARDIQTGVAGALFRQPATHSYGAYYLVFALADRG